MYARYTEVLRDIMRNKETAPLLEAAMSTYPLYSPEKQNELIPTREELNKAILSHYKYREIGFETVGRFLDELETTLCEIMPYYNERFRTIEIMAEIPNPFDNVDITETFEQTTTGSASSEGTSTSKQTGTASQSGSSSQTGTSEQSGTSTGSTSDEENNTHSDTNTATGTSTEASTTSQTSHGKKVRSDTPQDELGIGSKGIDSLGYASEAEWSKDETEGTGSNNTSTENSTEASGTATRTSTGTSQGSSTSTSESSSEASSTSQSTSETDGSGSTSMSSESSGTTRHTFTKKGQQGVTTFAQDIDDYRKKAIIDVKYEIITDVRLGELFMLVF